jgi:protein SCO1/2
VALSVLLCAALVEPVYAQQSGQMRREFEDVRIDEKLGETIPLDLTFRNEKGEAVSLGQYFDGDRPVMLTLNYYDCPMLCPMMLDQYTRTLKGIAWTPGDEFEAVTVSFDPDETPQMARQQKQGYVEALNKPGAGKGWHFLTGDQASIEALTDAVGYHFKKVEGKDEYAHPTAVIFLSGNGTITRYIYGLEIPPTDTRQALVEASNGTVGNVMDQIKLYCYQFDPNANSYTADAFAIMRIGGVLITFLLGGALVYFWRRERSSLEQNSFDERMEEGLDEYVRA